MPSEPQRAMSSGPAAKDTGSGRIIQKADAVLAAASRSLPASEHRSTAGQRQAFLEHLYSDYGELHAQQGEIHDRKNQMNVDLFDSNQQEIRDVLFARPEVSETALGDWDTWERVDAAMKRYVYGRPRHSAEHRGEAAAMRSRIEALNLTVKENAATVQELTNTCNATQQELGGLLKLLHLRDNKLRTLTNQFHTTVLQLRYVQRECAALRGLRSEDEASQLKQDLRFLIMANKKLEAENQLLRGREYVLDRSFQDGEASKSPAAAASATAAAPSPLMHQHGEALAVTDAELDRCIEDDAFRRELLSKEVPLSGAVVAAKLETAHWKRRLEAEVANAMAALDDDAGAVREVEVAAASAPPPRPGVEYQSTSENGVFISYALYNDAADMSFDESAAPLLVAPPLAPQPPLPSTSGDAAVAAASGSVAQPPASTAGAGVGAGLATDEKIGVSGDSVVAAKETRRAAAATAKAPAKAGAGKQPVAAFSASSSAPATSTAVKRLGVTTAAQRVITGARNNGGKTRSSALPFTTLRTTILRCAELSRANAMRRELLHVTHLRQMLEEEMSRAQAPVAAAAAEHPPAIVTGHDTDDAWNKSEGERVGEEERSRDDAAPGHLRSGERSQTLIDASEHTSRPTSSSTAAKLRQRIEEIRSPHGPFGAGDGGEMPSNTGGRRNGSAAPHVTGEHHVASDATPLHARVPLHAPTDDANPARHARTRHTPGEGQRSAAEGVCAPSTEPHVHDRQGTSDGSTAVTQDRHGATHHMPQTTASLRQDVTQLRADVVRYGKELQDALALLSRLLAGHELQLHDLAGEYGPNGAAMGAAGEAVVEDMALQRAAKLLEARLGTAFSKDMLSHKPVSDAAPDEEWLANELRAAAGEMIKDVVHGHGHGPTSDGAAGRLAALPNAVSAPGEVGMPADSGAQHVPRNYFETDIIRPFRLSPGFPAETRVSHRMNLMSGDDLRRIGEVGADDKDEDEGEGEGVKEGGAYRRAVGGAAAASRPGPAPATKWYRKAPFSNNFDNGGSNAPTRPRVPVSQVQRHAMTFDVDALMAPAAPQTSLQSLQPTVLRYIIGGRESVARGSVAAQIGDRAAYVYGQDFESFVRDYVVPIVSAASHISGGTKMNTAMRAAVQQLRQKERQRRKHNVRLLFHRVANNIRTRNLLRRNIYHGEAFVSYVGLLYSNWRAQLEEKRCHVQMDRQTDRSTLFSLLQLRSVQANDTLTSNGPAGAPAPVKPAANTEKRTQAAMHQAVQSSFHFDKAAF